MPKAAVSPFDSIESAHSFVQVLSSTLAETRKEVAADVDREPAVASNRRRDALLVAVYNLERLEYHLARSSRLLNDLRTIRRLLLEERDQASAAGAQAKPAPHTKAVPKNGHPVAVA